MVASTVSSRMVEAMAAVEGFNFVECLTGSSTFVPNIYNGIASKESTGFKFIGNTTLNLVSDGYEVPFGYEEAIGYMFGSEIRDKDGVSASVSLGSLHFGDYLKLAQHR